MRRATCALILGFTCCFTHPAAAAAIDDLDFAFQPHPGARLPLSAELADENGRPVALGAFFNKQPVVVVLEYLRCRTLCGVTLQGIVAALGGLPLEAGRDFQLLAISIDPRDKPSDAAAAKARYVALYGHRSGAVGMHFLTATEAPVRKIAATIGFPYRFIPQLDEFIHPAGFIVASPDGAISRYIEGVGVTSATLTSALADAEQDKSQGPLTRLLLFCHIEGAPIGRFTVPVLAAFTIADIAGGLGLIALFATIRRRRHG